MATAVEPTSAPSSPSIEGNFRVFEGQRCWLVRELAEAILPGRPNDSIRKTMSTWFLRGYTKNKDYFRNVKGNWLPEGLIDSMVAHHNDPEILKNARAVFFGAMRAREKAKEEKSATLALPAPLPAEPSPSVSPARWPLYMVDGKPYVSIREITPNLRGRRRSFLVGEFRLIRPGILETFRPPQVPVFGSYAPEASAEQFLQFIEKREAERNTHKPMAVTLLRNAWHEQKKHPPKPTPKPTPAPAASPLAGLPSETRANIAKLARVKGLSEIEVIAHCVETVVLNALKHA